MAATLWQRARKNEKERAVLEGIRIIEVEGLGPGPFAAMTLADLGAEVITIHRKGPSDSPAKTKVRLLDRGKKSVVLDLKDPSDIARFHDLAETADALIEGFRPGVMERLGLGPADLHARNPRLVYGRMTGWGQTGPLAHAAGHDLNYIALSGALHYASGIDEAPFTPPTMVGDIGGGALYLIIGILSGILRARETGQGTVVDAAIVDGSAHMMNLIMSLAADGRLSETRGQSLLDGPHWSRTYRCADGKYFSVQALEPKFYAIFLEKLGLTGTQEFKDQYDPQKWPDQTRALAHIFAAQPQAHWTAVFDGSDACAAPVQSPQSAGSHPHIAARGIWGETGGVQSAAPAPRFSNWTPNPSPRMVEKGADAEAIWAELDVKKGATT